MLDALFRPRGVAVVGASTKALSIGNVIVGNLLEYGYLGRIYPIHPSAPEVRGLRAFRSVGEVPGEIDVAHIILPARQVPRAVEDCGRKGIGAVIINSAGFREAGEEGARLQDEFLAHAARYGVRVFGPNCQGIVNTDPAVRAYCNFTFTRPEPGSVSVAAMSGGVGALIMQALHDEGVGMRMYASNGNACDVSIPEILEYWADDPGCRAILLYTEGLSEPGRFLETVRRVAASKPILAMKAGRTAQGARAASSHTGTMAGGQVAAELVFEKAGILTFEDEEEMVRAAKTLVSQPVPPGNRVGVVTNTGGPAVIAADVLSSAGLDLPELSGQAIERLKGTQLPMASLGNPVDVVATAGGDRFRAALEILLEEEGIDSILVHFVTAPFTDTVEVAMRIAEAGRNGRKPVVCNLMTDLSHERFRDTMRILKEGDVPFYSTPTAAAKALAAVTRFGILRRRSFGKPDVFADVDAAAARKAVGRARASGRVALVAEEVHAVLAAYGIPAPPWRKAGSPEEASRAAEEIGYPVAVKIETETIVHKSDAGGVALGLGDGAAVRAAAEEMGRRPGARGGTGFLVQGYVPGGCELIVGASAVKGAGHLVMFGLGGIHVEVLRDAVFRLAPVTRAEAREMIDSIRGRALLDGVRGRKGVDREKVVELIQRVSSLVTDVPEIREMDINPVLAFEDSVVAVDCRIGVE